MAFHIDLVGFMAKEVVPRCSSRDLVVTFGTQWAFASYCEVSTMLRHMGLECPTVTPQEAGRTLDARGRKGDLHPETMFKMLGFKRYVDIDISLDMSPKIVHDLNRALPLALYRSADLVVDGGTLEHVFDLKTAFENVVGLLKPGGWVFHISPVDWVNHGFVNFSPCLFHDLYKDNGFEQVLFWFSQWPPRIEERMRFWAFEYSSRLLDVRSWRDLTMEGQARGIVNRARRAISRLCNRGGTIMLVLAQKGHSVDFKVPIQGVYRRGPGGNAAEVC